MVYVGELESLFRAASARSNRGALFCFSTERQECAEYTLLTTARYAHSPGYVRSVASKHGWQEVACRDTTIRKDKGHPIPGQIFLLRKAG
jgi:predicted TPR repeat methyltransferase